MRKSRVIRTDADRARAARAIASLPGDCVWRVTVEKYRKNRSLQQNSYLWGVVYECIRRHVLESTGEIYSAEEIHEWCKQKFLPAKIVDVGGERHMITRSTATLTTVEMQEYIDQVIMWAADRLECMIPMPGQYDDV